LALIADTNQHCQLHGLENFMPHSLPKTLNDPSGHRIPQRTYQAICEEKYFL